MRAALVLLAAAGCSKAAADRTERSVLTLDERGERPWHLLRYEIPAGFEQDVQQVFDVDIEMSGALEEDIVLPRIAITETYGVDSVDGKGGMRLRSEVTDVEMSPRTGDTNMREANDIMAELEGLKMTATLTPDGQTRGLRLDASSVTIARDQLQQLEQSIDTVIGTLPDVPVGVGARWTVEETVRLSNMKVYYTFVYEVLELTPTTATLQVDLEMAAGPQPLVTRHGVGKLEVLAGEGSVEIAFDSHKVMDRARGTIDMAMTISAAGRTFDADSHVALQILPADEEPSPPIEPD